MQTWVNANVVNANVDLYVESGYKSPPEFCRFKEPASEEIRMKRVVFAFLVLLLTFAFQKQSAAESDGPSVSGSFQISTDGGPTRDIQFHAKINKNGSTTGEIIFLDRPSVSDPKGESADHFLTDSS